MKLTQCPEKLLRILEADPSRVHSHCACHFCSVLDLPCDIAHWSCSGGTGSQVRQTQISQVAWISTRYVPSTTHIALPTAEAGGPV